MERLTLTVHEVAKHLNISMPTAYELVKTKNFPCMRIGNRRFVMVDAFKRWVEENTGQGGNCN